MSRRPPELAPAVTDLAELAAELLDDARTNETRRAARVVLSGADLRATVIALLAEGELGENAPRTWASLQVLSGAVTLRVEGDEWVVGAGTIVPIGASRHSLRADVDSTLLLTVPLL